MNFAEMRSFIRAEVNIPIALQINRNPASQAQAVALNISVEGIYLVPNIALSVGEHIGIQLPRDDWEHISLTACVIRQQGEFFACKFVDPPLEIRKILDNAVYKLWHQSLQTTFSKAN